MPRAIYSSYPIIIHRTIVLIFIFFLIGSTNSIAQDYSEFSIEELTAKLGKETDTSHISINVEIAYQLQKIYEDDSSHTYIENGLALCDKFQYFRHLPTLHRQMAIYYEYAKMDHDSALLYFRRALSSAKKHADFPRQFRGLRDVIYAHNRLEHQSEVIWLLDTLVHWSKSEADTTRIVEALCLKAQMLESFEKNKQASLCIDEAIDFSEIIGDSLERAKSYEMIAQVFWNSGNMTLALNHYLKASLIFEAFKDTSRLFEVYNSINNLYDDLGNYPKALDYAKRTTRLLTDSDDLESIANAYNTVGWVYKNLNNNDSALLYFRKSYRFYLTKLPNHKSIAYPIGNIGLVMNDLNQHDSAIFYSKKAEELFGILQLESGVAESVNNIGMALIAKGDLKEAEENLKRGLKLATNAEDIFEMRNSYWGLYVLNKVKPDFKSAMDALEFFVNLGDSLYSIEDISSTQELEAMLAKSRDEERINALQAKSQLDKALIRQQRLINYGIGMLTLVVMFSMVLVFRNWKSKRKAYDKLSKKHAELQASKQKIQAQHDEIDNQKQQIEQQHTDIIDSINFASRIQQALLKPEDHVNKSLPDHFILFKPRDIVSGDFYWAVLRNNHLFIAAVDCTGHGVPGAMMSMLGIAFLNEIMATEDELMPSRILDKLRDKIIKELGQEEQTDSNYREGMDVALVRLDLDSKELVFAGANNPLWLVRDKELISYKANSQGISYSSQMKPFTQEKVQLKRNDSFYIFSDGFPDQFGGQRGKKLKAKAFKELLLQNAGKVMDAQKRIIDDYFENWRGEQEQIDDVCVIGVKI